MSLLSPAARALALLLVLGAAGASAEQAGDPEVAIGAIGKVLAFRRHSTATPTQAALGRRLFFDPSLSADAKMSCATCHLPSRHFEDGLPKALGRNGKPVARNTPSLLNAAFYEELFWDGRAATIEDAALVAVQNPDEMDQPVPGLVAKVRASAEYRAAFARAYPDASISSATIASSLGAFVVSLASPEDSPFDHYLNDRSGLSPAALRGFLLFAGKARCIECHMSRHLNYNQRYINIGVKPGAVADVGRYKVDPRPEMWGAFRVPSLRNVALTGPYMHDGSLPTLESVIDFYDRGGDDERFQTPAMEPLHLSPREKGDLLAFLRSLTSSPPALAAKEAP